MAAALIVGILWPRAQSQHDVATLAMVNGHFSHAQFAGTGPKAKVLYARDRSWYYVIVAGTGRYDVYGVAGEQSRFTWVDERGRVDQRTLCEDAGAL